MKIYFFVIFSFSKAYCVYNKCSKVIEEFIHVVFEETSHGYDSLSSFDGFQLSKYVDDEDEGVLDKCNHQSVPL